jgi:hypothetical protein
MEPGRGVLVLHHQGRRTDLHVHPCPWDQRNVSCVLILPRRFTSIPLMSESLSHHCYLLFRYFLASFHFISLIKKNWLPFCSILGHCETFPLSTVLAKALESEKCDCRFGRRLRLELGVLVVGCMTCPHSVLLETPCLQPWNS